MGRTVLVCGGRNFTQRAFAYSVLDRLRIAWDITQVIHGSARGADRIAGEWAKQRGVAVIACPANWRLYGRGAGHVRNAEMLAMGPYFVVAFPGGAGTADMVRRAEAAGVAVLRLNTSDIARFHGLTRIS